MLFYQKKKKICFFNYCKFKDFSHLYYLQKHYWRYRGNFKSRHLCILIFFYNLWGNRLCNTLFSYNLCEGEENNLLYVFSFLVLFFKPLHVSSRLILMKQKYVWNHYQLKTLKRKFLYKEFWDLNKCHHSFSYAVWQLHFDATKIVVWQLFPKEKYTNVLKTWLHMDCMTFICNI